MQGFRSSINLHFDLPNPKLLDRYVLTPSHCDVLNGILEGVVNTEGKHAHLLIGPYGTGKSLLSTIVCQLVSRKFSEEWRIRLLTQTERIDTRLADYIRNTESVGLTYIPVMINGKTGSFRTIINQAIYRALHQAKIEVITPNEASSILNVVDRWKQLYPDTYKAFLCHLEAKQVQEIEWRAHIESCHEEMTRDFISFYPSVTSGTTWMVEHDTYFIENLEKLSSELVARGIGLFVVYDEFGRFLQSLGGENTLQDMQDLQNLAEFVDRVANIHLLVVGHKHIRQYAASSRESIRQEFEKVEKRFRFYSLENDSSTFLQLAQEAIIETNTECLNEEIKLESVETLQNYTLFNEFTSYQLEQGIVRALYPLHPVAVMLLPHLSNIFGQNERTLFSFLSDDERYSLRDYVNQNKGYYYADQMFNFFSVGLAEPKDQPSLQLYHSIAPYLDSQMLLQRRIVELLTMWSVTRLTQKQPITTKFLAFAVGTGLEEIAVLLELMSESKIIRFNSIREQWELYDGSSIDLGMAVQSRLASTTLQNKEVMHLLERHLPMTYILPYEYNEDMDMLRYADIHFADVSELKVYQDGTLPADDRIWLIVYQDMDQIEDPITIMNEMTSSSLVAFPHFSVDNVQSSLLNFKVIDQLLHDSEFLSQDARLKNELTYMLQETSKHIQVFVDRYFAFHDLEWWSGKEQKSIVDLNELERLVTHRLRSKYNVTPHIRNEAFNRNRISAIQRRALIDVIDHLIQQPREPALGISGYGPNYLIYATALKNNDYYIDAEGNVQCNGTLAEIRNALREVLDSKPIGKLSDLIGMMKSPPYGIRSSVIPLLFVALLRDRWDQLHLFANDMLISSLSGASILEIIELSESFEYRYYNWTIEEKHQLIELGGYFDLPEETCTSFLLVADALLQWLRSLPKFTQITRQITKDTQRIRDIIRSSEVDPFTNIKQLATYGHLLLEAKSELEQFHICNEHELERQVLKVTGQTTLLQMFPVLKKFRNEAIGKNSKLLTLSLSEEGQGIIDSMAEQLVGVARTEWSDATQDLFIGQIKYEWELLHSGVEISASLDKISDHNVPLSKKSQTLYANVKNMLKYAGRDISTQEVRQLLVKLLHEL
ncbi:hypothetical protein [Paenibacillus radicis (ex Gao et al. 2016)]|uniref:ATP-binding protein n=1 Tax=Paenibacillus radicis (ex Gao et al. 2016) TaxID=1737354 RepID=A0A917H4Y5_9BACL|nr:hypothetical protein [Paenibacillus radicis (ex Gao et al. 2016)]GGG67378.1 hypothetical protein GCM10010918_22500 [Paenibacillus radicis (ex Gao et al. 2016)]